MDYKEKEGLVIRLGRIIDDSIDSLEASSITVQNRILKIIRGDILNFEIAQGRFVSSEDMVSRILRIERNIERELNSNRFKIPVRDFLHDFDKFQDDTISFHKRVSNLTINKDELTPIKRFLYDQALEGFERGIATSYIEPVKKLLANQVMSGASITETVDLLEKWNEGDLTSGRYTRGQQTPNLQRYATQIARDTAYAVPRNTNQAFKDKFNLTKFIYAGNLVKDSRPLCKHIVALNREVEFDELPPIIAAYPQGLYPGTTKDNFSVNAGGYNCRHIVMSVA